LNHYRDQDGLTNAQKRPLALASGAHGFICFPAGHNAGLHAAHHMMANGWFWHGWIPFLNPVTNAMTDYGRWTRIAPVQPVPAPFVFSSDSGIYSLIINLILLPLCVHLKILSHIYMH